MNANDRLELLKQLLLNEEKEATTLLSTEIEEVKKILENEDGLAGKIDPLLQKKLDAFTKEELAPLVLSSLKNEIKKSQDTVVAILFPIVGKMIKRYVAHEFKLLNERISAQINNTFTFSKFSKRKMSKREYTDQVIANTMRPELLHVFIIEKNSGLLIAKHSNTATKTIDEDMLAGMLTAIKSFVEDAFTSDNQTLENITYNEYTLHVQDFFNYYITGVISGSYTLATKSILEDNFLDFAQNVISKLDLEDSNALNKKLKRFFKNEIN